MKKTIALALILAATTAANADWNYTTKNQRDAHIADCSSKGDCYLSRPALDSWTYTDGGAELAEQPYFVCRHEPAGEATDSVYTNCCVLLDSADTVSTVHAVTCCNNSGTECTSCQGTSCAEM